MANERNANEEVDFLLVALLLDSLQHFLVFIAAENGELACGQGFDGGCSRDIVDESYFAERLAHVELNDFRKPLERIELHVVVHLLNLVFLHFEHSGVFVDHFFVRG